MTFWSAIEHIGGLGDQPTDTADERLKHRLLVYLALWMSVGGLIWGVFAGAIGLFLPSVIPLSYVVLSAVNMLVFRLTHNFERARVSQVGLSLLLPFAFQLSMGGFHHSGAGMLWAMIAILGSLTFDRARRAAMWLVMYGLLTLTSGLLEASVAPQAPAIPTAALTAFFVFNIITITSIVFGLAIWLLHQRDLAVQNAERINDELTTTNVQLESALHEAKAATEAKSRFLANMSHELRTPLNAVLGMSELLASTELNDLQRDYISTVESSGQALFALVSDILDLSKIEANAVLLRRRPVDVALCLKRVIDVVAPLAKRKGIEIELQIAPSTPGCFELDVDRFRQVMMNLVSNAVKFTDHGRVRVELAVMENDAGVLCRVIDTGIGIEASQIESLTKPFVQADASIARRFGGTGLGLAISRNLVELHGGRLSIRSEPGVGSTFEVCFPATVCASPGPAGTEPESRDLSALRVLLVEDNPVNRKVAHAMLKRLGLHADEAHDGEQAVEAVAVGAYDVVLMDLMMPRMDGLEAATKIRASPGPHPTLVAMTANVLTEDLDRCRAVGMRRSLLKPFTLQDLQSILAEIAATKHRAR